MADTIEDSFDYPDSDGQMAEVSCLACGEFSLQVSDPAQIVALDIKCPECGQTSGYGDGEYL